MEQVRWKQRFTNLERAFMKLERGLQIFSFEEYQAKRRELKENMSHEGTSAILRELEELDLEREGIIQRFEYSFELFVNTLKDLLEFYGEPQEKFRGSRTILATALERGLIEDHDRWREMVLSRNKTSHTYDEETANEITENIVRVYFPLMKKLYVELKKEYRQ